MAELFDKRINSEECAVAAQRWPAGLVTNCTSLSDSVTRKRVQLTDRRLSLDAAIIRQEARHCVIKLEIVSRRTSLHHVFGWSVSQTDGLCDPMNVHQANVNAAYGHFKTE